TYCAVAEPKNFLLDLSNKLHFIQLAHSAFDERNLNGMVYGIPDEDWVDLLVEMCSRKARKIILLNSCHEPISVNEATRLFQIIHTKKLEVLISSNIQWPIKYASVEGYTVNVFPSKYDGEIYRFEIRHNSIP
ncbi:hypothetical protein PFISCL1PPCAC_16940, partial [Pristionchus fissidentatus]